MSEATKKKSPLGSEGNPKPSPGFCYNVDGFIVFEQVKNRKGEMAFARSDVDLSVKPEPKIKIEDTWYKPLTESRVYWCLPGEPESYPSEEWLFNENRKFIYDYADVKEPGAYDVLAAFALATWRFEDWQSFPYLFFVGHYGAGKSTLQRVLKQICRRAVGGPSITVSSFVSMMDRFQATVMPDEAQIFNSEDSPEMIAILRGAYQRGNLRIKSVPTGNGWTDKAYNAFGFCVLAAHDPLDEGIMQRCLPFAMVKRTRKLKKWRKPEFLIEGSHLRNWNLQYRFLHLGDDDVDDDLLEEIKDDRLQELALPLLTVAPAGLPRQNILSFFKTLQKRKQVETESGDEADYFRALDFFSTEKGKDFIKPESRILLSAFKQTLLKVKQEAEAEYDPKWLTPRAMWKVLERLGFHHGGHTREGSSITFDRSRLDALRPQFAPQETLQPEPSLPPSTVTTITTVTPIENDVMDVTDVTVTRGKGGRITCPRCKITWPDQPSYDNHLSTYKHAISNPGIENF